jgi:hypothetical protein
MRAATLIPAAVCALGLAACGGGTKTVVERTVVTQAPAPPATTVRPAAPQQCGAVNVHLAHGSEGGSTSIAATGVDCETAKRVVGACIQGRVEDGWRIVSENTGARFVATQEGARIAFNLVGGGGCTPV